MISLVNVNFISLNRNIQILSSGKADYATLQNANTIRPGIFWCENIQNGAAGSGIEIIMSASSPDGTMVIQQSTVMSGSNANRVYARRYINNAWNQWIAL